MEGTVTIEKPANSSGSLYQQNVVPLAGGCCHRGRASLDGVDVGPFVAFPALDEALVKLAAVQGVLQRALVAVLQH